MECKVLLLRCYSTKTDIFIQKDNSNYQWKLKWCLMHRTSIPQTSFRTGIMFEGFYYQYEDIPYKYTSQGNVVAALGQTDTSMEQSREHRSRVKSVFN